MVVDVTVQHQLILTNAHQFNIHSTAWVSGR